MKKPTKTALTTHARAAVLTRYDLTSVIGGTGGTIVVENVVAVRQGIQGSGQP